MREKISGIIRASFCATIITCFSLVLWSSAFASVTYTWNQNDPLSDYYWYTETNWTPTGVPTINDHVIFDSTSTKMCSIDASVNVKSITIMPSYTGTIEQTSPLTVANDFTQFGGTFNSRDPANNMFSVSGNFFVTAEALFTRYNGSGTVGNPYGVRDIYGLQAIRCNANLSKSFVLTTDIDASATAGWNWNATRATFEGFVPIGHSFGNAYSLPTNGFSGTLEGNYKRIVGLKMDKSGSSYMETAVGLFGFVSSSAVIRNIFIENARIWYSDVIIVGGVAGVNWGNISRVSFDGELLYYPGPLQKLADAAGLVGINLGGSISESVVNVAFSYITKPFPARTYSNSGIASLVDGGSIENCYANISRHPSLTVSGIARSIQHVGTILKNCYASGSLSYGVTQSYTFGVGTIENCYYLDLAGTLNQPGIYLPPDLSVKQSSYQEWDFEQTWSIEEGMSVPFHIWSQYNWLGSATAWEIPTSWNLGRGYPSFETHSVYLGSGSVGLNSPSSAITIGSITLKDDFNSRLRIESQTILSRAGGRSGSLFINSGTFEGNSKLVSISGDLRVDAGAYFFPHRAASPGSGTLEVFDGSSASNLQGDIRYWNFRCSTPYKRITVEASSVHTVEGSLYLSGEAEKEIMIRSSVPGQQWYVHPQSTVVANHLIVADSHNLGAEITALNSYDGGNNHGWVFGGYTVSVHSNEGGYISPAGILGEVLEDKGTPTTLGITANPGYYIGYVRIDGTLEAGPYASNPHTVIVPGNMAHSVEAFFVPDNIKIWHGGGMTNLWSNADNWTGYSLPGENDYVVFNADSGSSRLDAPITVKNITMEAGFQGVITHEADLTIKSGFEQYGGYFLSDYLSLFTTEANFRLPDTQGHFKRFSGNGTSSLDAYIIYDIYGLQAVKCHLDKHFKLNNDIDAGLVSAWRPVKDYAATGFDPIGAVRQSYLPQRPFTGTFNGNDNTVSNISMNRPNDADNSNNEHVAFFGNLSSAGVYRLGLKDMLIQTNMWSSAGFVGLLYDSEIADCYVSISGNSTGLRSGFVNYLQGGGSIIQRCYAYVDDNTTSHQSAGFAYSVFNDDVRDCYVDGYVGNSFSTYVGGFVQSGGTRNSYSKAVVRSNPSGTNVGGFASQGVDSDFSNCFYTYREPHFNNLAVFLSESNSKEMASYQGWDFDETWSIDEGVSTPYLMWENFNWRGDNGNNWDDAENWSRFLSKAVKYPSAADEKVFLQGNTDIQMPGSGLVLGELRLGSLYDAVLSLNAGLVLSNEAYKGGHLAIFGGTLEAGTHVITIEGDFRVALPRMFDSAGSTVEMAGTSISYLGGSKRLADFTVSVPGKHVTFESGSIHTIEGRMFFSGESDGLVTLSGSRSSPEVWYIDPQGQKTANNLIVRNSHNIGDLIEVTNSFDGGNNHGWTGFSGYIISVMATGEGGSVTPLGDNTVGEGLDLVIEITTDEGYYIGFIKKDGVSQTGSLVSPLSLTVTADNFHSVEVIFVPAGTKKWTGNGATNNWSDGNNWTGNTPPNPDETVVFDSTSSKPSIIDSDFNAENKISALYIMANSSIVLTQEASLSITSTYEQLSGTFRCIDPANYALTIEGSFSIPHTPNHINPSFFRLGGGPGTNSTNPYTVYDIYGLQALNNRRGATSNYYRFAGHIDASPTRKWDWNGTTHEGFVPLGDTSQTFSGLFQGNHYKLTDLWINRPGQDRVGLFGSTQHMTLSDFTLEDINIIGKNYVGVFGLVSASQPIITGVGVSGYVQGYGSSIGGVVGYAYNLILASSYFDGDVTNHSSTRTGGLAGNLTGSNSSLINCYAKGVVQSNNTYTGGLIGESDFFPVKNSFFEGSVLGSGTGVGGLIGSRLFSFGVDNCFFNDSNPDNGHGTALSADDMKKRRIFTEAGWDFGRAWGIADGTSTPYLQHEKWLWTGGAGDGLWNSALNWNKRNLTPNEPADVVFINTVEAASFTMPSSNLTLGQLQFGTDFNKVASIEGDRLSLTASGGGEGSLYIYGGKFDSKTKIVNVDSNFHKAAAAVFSAGTGTVSFPASSRRSLISGNTVFYNLSCLAPGKSLSFEAGSVQTIEGAFNAAGAYGSPVHLSSSVRYATWEIMPQGSRSVQFATVQDSRNLSATEINASNSVDRGNNHLWTFSDYAVEVFVGSHGFVNTMEGVFYLSTEEGGAIVLVVSAESPSYYIADVKIDGLSTTESLYHPGDPHVFVIGNIQKFYTFEALFEPVGTKRWKGKAPSNNWSHPYNWTGNHTPEPSDIVLFTSLSTKDAVINAVVTVESMFMENDYGGTVRQERNLTVLGSFEQAGGFFVCTMPATAVLTVGQNFSIPSVEGSFIRYTGTGTIPAKAFTVHDIYGLQAMKCNLNKHFKLNFDIDASTTRKWNWNPNTSTHEGFDPIGTDFARFTGSLSGESFIVKDLWINRAAIGNNNIGLFGVVGTGGLVHRVGIRNPYVRGFNYVGAMAGRNYGAISRCLTDGGIVVAHLYGGGFVGENSGNISDAYSSASIQAIAYPQALFVGNNASGGSIARSYTAGSILPGSWAGEAFLGANEGTVQNCYFSTLESGKTLPNHGAEPLNPAEMKDQWSFEEWDFDTVWSIDDAKSYPHLLWEIWNWTGAADGTSWSNPGNWNKKSDYPRTRNDKVYINAGTGAILTPLGDITIGSLILGPNFNHILSLRGNLTLGDDGPREGSLLLLGGSLASTVFSTIRVEGRFKNTVGSFLEGSTLIFSGDRPSIIEGSTDFYNLYCTEPGKQLIFEAGSVQTIEGTLRISSEAGISGRIVLKSLSDGEWWFINPTGTKETVYFVDVSDSVNLSLEAINPFYSIETGDTVNWFDTYYITAEVSRVPPLDPMPVWGYIYPSGEVPVKHGDQQEFVVIAGEHYKIVGIEVDGVSKEGFTPDEPYAYTFEAVSRYHSIEALFAVKPALITTEVSGTGSGTITPSGTIEVGMYQRQVFTVEADPGSYLAFFRVDGQITVEGMADISRYGNPYWVTFEGASRSHTIEAVFLTIDTYIWTGRSGEDLLWSNKFNWTDSTTPPAGSTVIFSGIYDENSQLDSLFVNTLESVYLTEGYSGQVDIQSVMTVESLVSIESGTLRQGNNSHVHLSGDLFVGSLGEYNTEDFPSSNGSILNFISNDGEQLFVPGGEDNSFPHVIHSGSGLLMLSGESPAMVGHFLNASGAGDFEMFKNGLFVHGSFTNEAVISHIPDWDLPIYEEEGLFFSLRNAIVVLNTGGGASINSGGTEEGKELPIILYVDYAEDDSAVNLESPIKSIGVFGYSGVLKANGHDMFLSSFLYQNNFAYGEALFHPHENTVHIIETDAETAEGLFPHFLFDGRIVLHSLECTVPAKTVKMNNATAAITIEETGSVRFQGGALSEEFITISGSGEVPADPKWLFDPRCSDENRVFYGLKVSDSWNISEREIIAENSTNEGNNIGWLFDYRITAEANAGGTIVPSGEHPYPVGGRADYSISSDAGNYIAMLLVDGKAATPDAGYYSVYFENEGNELIGAVITFESVYSYHTLEAYFAKTGSRVWSGASGTDLNWSTPGNWFGGFAPMSTQEAVFDYVGKTDSNIDGVFGGVVVGLTMKSGYEGLVSVERTITVEGDVSVEAGVLFQDGFDIYVSGDWYSVGTSQLLFSSESGAVIFDSDDGEQLITVGMNPGEPVDIDSAFQARFYDLIHSGAGTLKLSENLYIRNDFANLSGVFHALYSTIAVKGDFVNSAYFTMEVRLEWNEDDSSYDIVSGIVLFPSGGRVQSINMGGTGEGHIIPMIQVYNPEEPLQPPILSLEGDLETAVLLVVGTLEVNSNSMYISSALMDNWSLETGEMSDYEGHLYITPMPEEFLPLSEGIDLCYIFGLIQTVGLSCDVPGKRIAFGGIITVEAGGYITFEGIGFDTDERINLVKRDGLEMERWFIDAKTQNRTVNYVYVQDSHNIDDTPIDTQNSYGDNNIGWIFGWQPLRAFSEGPGTVDPSGEFLIPDGGSITWEVTADPGHQIARLLIDGQVAEEGPNVTFVNDEGYFVYAIVTIESISSPHSIDAYFVRRGTSVWTGAGADDNWSTPDNWLNGIVPTSTREAVFNGLGQSNSVVDGAFGDEVGSVSVESGYSYVVRQDKSLAMDGSFALYGGSWNMDGNNLFISGDFRRSDDAAFVHSSGAVILSGEAPSEIEGSTSFAWLACSQPGKTITFEAGSVTTAELGFNMIGSEGAPVYLRSSSIDSNWMIDPRDHRSVYYAVVHNSTNINAAPIYAYYSAGEGSVINWLFEDARQVVWNGSGSTLLWSDPYNWSINATPESRDILVFNATSAKDAIIDEDFHGEIFSLIINSTYTGTMIQSLDVTIAATFEQRGGVFVSDVTKGFTVEGSFSLPTGYSSNPSFRRFSGAGSGADPYVVYDVYGLQAVNHFRSNTFRLGADIDASVTSLWNPQASYNEGFVPIRPEFGNPFNGIFDGNGRTISNLHINNPSMWYVGLFGVLGNAEVNNIFLENANIRGYGYVGGLAGYAWSNSVIRNSGSDGSVYGYSNVGGAVGYIAGSVQSNVAVSNCYSKGVVSGDSNGSSIGGFVGNITTARIESSYSDTTVIGGSYDVGGFAGRSWSADIIDCYSLGAVNTNDGAGGFIGNAANAPTNITRCYSSGKVKESSGNGGFAYINNAVNTSNYWDNTVNPSLNDWSNGSTSGVSGLSTSSLQQRLTYAGWDYDKVWSVDSGKNYPELTWQLYNWTGEIDNDWSNTSNWRVAFVTPESPPLGAAAKVFINHGDRSITVPTGYSYGSIHIGPDFDGTVSLAESILLDNSGARDGSLTVLGGVFDPGTYDIAVSGGFRRGPSADIDLTQSEVSFVSSAPSLIEGSTSFNDLVCTFSGKDLTFEAGSVQTIEGSFTVTGGIDAPISLFCFIPSGEWVVDPRGDRSVTYTKVMGSFNINDLVITAENSVDLGNNTNWSFDSILITSYFNDGGTIVPAGDRIVSLDTDQDYLVTADADYYIVYVLVDGEEVPGPIASPFIHTFESVSQNHSIEASFISDDIKIWDGGGDTSSWSEPENWLGDSLPAPGDSVLFSGISSKNSVLDAGFDGYIGSISVESSYNGVITMNRHLTAEGFIHLHGGTIDAQANTLYVGGDWINTGGMYLTAGKTIFNKPSGVQIINSGSDFIIESGWTLGKYFYDLDISGGSIVRLADSFFQVKNDLVVSSGTFDSSSIIHVIGGDFTLLGDFAYEVDPELTPPITLMANEDSIVQSLTISGTEENKRIFALYSLSSPLDLRSDVYCEYGLFFVDNEVNVNGNTIYTKGDFLQESSEIVWSGGGLVLEGTGSEVSNFDTDVLLNDLTCVTPGKIIEFDDDVVATLEGTFRIQGSPEDPVYILGGSYPSEHWFINPMGARDVKYADVQSSINVNERMILARYSIDSGENSGWLFADSLAIVTIAHQGGTIEPSGEIPVAAGEPATFEVRGFGGNHISSLMIDGSKATNEVAGVYTAYFEEDYGYLMYALITFEGVSSDHVVEAHFGGEGLSIWKGTGANLNWTNPDNWIGGKVPLSTYEVVFNEIAQNNSLLNSGFHGRVASVSLESGFEHKVEQNRMFTVEGDFILQGGEWDTNNQNLMISGGFMKDSEADFIVYPNRSVRFIGADPSLIQGSTTFTRFICEVPGKALTFEAGSLQTITELMRITGVSGSRIFLRSTDDGMQWRINPTSAEVAYVNVKDSSNEAAFFIDPAGSNINVANNYKWFPSSAMYIITATSSDNGQISPEGEISVPENSSKTFNFYPEAGYYVSSVEVDGVGTTEQISYTFSGIVSDHTIYASFAAITDQRNITASVAANQGGTIEPIGVVPVQVGGSRMFKMVPNGGWYINNILVDGAGITPVDSKYAFTNVTENRTIVVVYLQNTESVHLITAETSGSGSGTIRPTSIPDGPIGVLPGSNMTFFIESGSGSYVSGLYVDGEPQPLQSEYSFTNVSSNHVIIASFEPIPYTITSTYGPWGIIVPAGEVEVPYGGDKLFEIIPDPGYRIDQLKIDNVTVVTTPEYKFVNVTSDHAIHATFTSEPFSIIATAGTGGTINPSGEVSVIYGSNQTFYAQPDSGYQLNGLLIDGAVFTTESSYTFYNVVQSHSIEATFEPYGEDTLYITVEATGGGTVEPFGIVGVAPGGSQVFVITPYSGNHISSLSLDGDPKPIQSIYEIKNVSTGYILSVVFASNTGVADIWLITAEAQGQGSISPEGSIGVKNGASQSFVMSADLGNTLLGLRVDGVETDVVSVYTFSGVGSHHSIEAVFSGLIPPAPPSRLRASVEGNDVVLAWNTVSGADAYRIYRSSDRFAPITAGWDLVEEVSGTTWTDFGIADITLEAYYIVRANNSGGVGEGSSIGIYKKSTFIKNTPPPDPPRTNFYRISLPYTSAYRNAQDIVEDIEGHTGEGSNTKIRSIGKWNPEMQQNTNVCVYSTALKRWLGDFALEAGTGIVVEMSGNTDDFDWDIEMIKIPVE